MKKFFAALLVLLGVCAVSAVSAKTYVVEAETEVLVSSAAPTLDIAATGREGELRISLRGEGFLSGARYAVRESATGQYVDPFSGALTLQAVWGSYEDWGAERGAIVKTGSISAPSFFGLAMNLAGEVSAPSAPVTLGGDYRGSREPLVAIAEGATYVVGALAFVCFAGYQVARMRSKPETKKRKK